MFGRRASRGPEHLVIDEVERLLDAAATRYRPRRKARPVPATHALWFCACVSEADDCPVWLIHDTASGDVVWCRVPGALDVPDLVDARLVAGAHVHPGEVRLWLQGRAPVPWSDGDGDPAVLTELGRQLRQRA